MNSAIQIASIEDVANKATQHKIAEKCKTAEIASLRLFEVFKTMIAESHQAQTQQTQA
ncbi:hypothetical protein CUPS4244_00370 [Campylobacter upsaliensis]|uniref:hypothetical protein n=1 Tax=Campylobacter upsaliensis TaxID=28080 RepID=UPI00214A2264|nr:hypothetical protein [Campylobacter upsaliensis]MCR2103552.1 hypothetical protein [Campylobacter upsaliensis]